MRSSFGYSNIEVNRDWSVTLFQGYAPKSEGLRGGGFRTGAAGISNRKSASF